MTVVVRCYCCLFINLSYYSTLVSFDVCPYILASLLFSLGECPKGPAWADKAYATDLAHQAVECSNAGLCDRTAGICTCYPGFTGNACQRSTSAVSVPSNYSLLADSTTIHSSLLRLITHHHGNPCVVSISPNSCICLCTFFLPHI